MSLAKLSGIVIALIAGTAVTVSDYVQSREPLAALPMESVEAQQEGQLSQEAAQELKDEQSLSLHAA